MPLREDVEPRFDAGRNLPAVARAAAPADIACVDHQRVAPTSRGLQGNAEAGVAGPDDDYVHFWSAGEAAKGEFHCAECGYGVTVHTQLPVCPMCASESWEQTTWSPFSRADSFAGL